MATFLRSLSSRPGTLVLAGAVVVLGIHAAFYAPFFSDDALISARYADRLVDGLGLTWTDGERVEGYTDLLWILLLAAVHALGVDLIVAARALGSVGCLAGVLLVALSPLSGKLRFERALAGSLGLALCPPVAIWAIGGLEHGLMVGVLIGVLYLMARAARSVGRARETWVVAGLLSSLVLLRADGAVLVFALVWPSLFFRSGAPHPLRRFLLWAGLPMLTLGGQHLFRHSYYGEWVPNTALAKVAMNAERVARGFEHVGTGLLALSPVLLLTGTLFVLARRRMRWSDWAPALSATVVWSLYLALVGGDIFPGWRQLLLGLVPIFFLLAQSVEHLSDGLAEEELPRLRGLLVAMLCLGFFAQTRDSENQRGKSERWEWGGLSVGPVLKRAFGEQQALLAVDAAGALPYWSELPSLDMLGLNDSYIAHHPPKNFGHGGIGHELGDGSYVLSRKPDLIAFNNAVGAKDPLFLSGRQMVRTAEFRNGYRPVHVLGLPPLRALGVLHVRTDGKAGFQPSEHGLTIPGYFLSSWSAPAELGEGDELVARFKAGTVARFDLPPLPPGTYRVTWEASGNLQMTARCDRQTMMPSASRADEGLLVRVTKRGRVALVAGTDQTTEATLHRVHLEKMPQSTQGLRCASRVLRLPLSALSKSKRENSAWNAPSNVVFRHRLRVTLPRVLHASSVSVSVDNNDAYELDFVLAGRSQGKLRVPPQANGGGMARHELPLPIEVSRAGFDEVGVSHLKGDGAYSLGHMIFSDAAPQERVAPVERSEPPR